MNNSFVFAKRNLKELIRDPLSLVFGIVLPLFLLIVMTQFNIPSVVYTVEYFAPSISVFSFSFITLFVSLLVAKDRSSSFLPRLFSSPLSSTNFILGYSLAILPICLIQIVVFMATALILGLTFSINVLWTILFLVFISIFFVGSGILIGTAFTDKQSGGICSVFIQFVVWTSGMWFDWSMLSTSFKTIGHIFPFAHMIDLSRDVLAGNFSNILIPILVIFGYSLIIYLLTIFTFKQKMKSK